MPFTESLKFVEVLRLDNTVLNTKPENVESGKLYIGSTKKLETGSMPVQASHGDVNLLAGETHIVPYGKISKAYNVNSATLASQTPGNATSGSIAGGYSAWVNGVKVDGSMTSISPTTVTLQPGTQFVIPEGYHGGTGIVKSADLTESTQGTALPSDIIAGKVAYVNGRMITGTAVKHPALNVELKNSDTYNMIEGFYPAGQIKVKSLQSVTESNATSDDLLEGKYAVMNGSKTNGTMKAIASQATALPLNGTYTIPKGYHSGLGTVTQNIPVINDKVTITPSARDQIIATAGKFYTQNITVPGIDVLNYQYATNEKGTFTPKKIIEDKTIDNSITAINIPVDNWHDNKTINIYTISITSVYDGAGNKKNNTLFSYSGVINFIAKNTEASFSMPGVNVGNVNNVYNVTPSIKAPIVVKGTIDNDTSAQVITITINDSYITEATNAHCHLVLNINEIFRARKFGME